MQTIIWSKTNCPYCDRAKSLLDNNGIRYEERNLSHGEWTREQLLEVVPTARTVPQIFLHGTYVGGYDDLLRYYEDHDMFRNNP